LLTQDGGKTEADVIHDIDDLFWITNTDEYFSADGWRVILDIADQSAIERDDVQILVGAIDAVTVGEVTAQPTFNGYQWGPYQEPINSSNDVTFQMRIDEYTLEVVSVKLSLRTRPFVTTTLPRSHRHRMFLDGGTVINDATERRFLAADSSTGFINLHMFINNAFLGDDVYTYDAEAGAEYGVYRDTLYPSTVTLKVNGVTIASGLDSGGVGINDVYDITSAVLGKVGGYRNTDHSIEVECTGGRGMIEATALVYRHISQIRI
jgi:hypothetical protein